MRDGKGGQIKGRKRRQGEGRKVEGRGVGQASV